MAEGKSLRVGAQDNCDRMTALSNSIQNHFKQLKEEALAATEYFQVHVDQEELNSLDFPLLSRNSNNNTALQNDPDIQVKETDSFHSIKDIG